MSGLEPSALVALNGFLPFLRHLQIEFVVLDPAQARARMPAADSISNGHGGVHATALSALGEAATLAAVQGLLIPYFGMTPPLARASWTRFRRVAIGPLEGRGAVIGDHARAVIELRDTGRTDLATSATVIDQAEAVVADVSVDYHVRLQRGRD